MTAKLHRKDLKHDEIRDKVIDTVKNVSLHGKEVIYIVTVVFAVLFITLIWRFYESRQNEKSQNQLGIALDKLEASVGEQPPAADPQAPKPEYSYKTEKEKYSAALKDFEAIDKSYGNTPAAEASRYYAGISAFYLGDNGKAENYLKRSSNISDRNVLYYLSRMALADLYNAQNKSDQAIKVLKEAQDKNKSKSVVPPENLLMALAETYKKAGKDKEATAAFQEIVSKHKESPLAYQAESRLSEMKGTK